MPSSPGCYRDLVLMAVDLGDLSMLQPLSVRDAIWLTEAQHRRRQDKAKEDEAKLKFALERLEEIELYMLDIREVSRDTNVYVKLAALKGGKRAPKVKPFPFERLPSEIVAKRKRKDKEIAKDQKKSQAELDKEQDELVARCVAHMNKERENELRRAAVLKEKQELEERRGKGNGGQ